MNKLKVDVLGSCISRVILLNGNISDKGTCDERIELEYFFDKNNIVSAMMPPPFSREEVEEIKAEELYDGGRIKSLKQGLNKDTVNMIMEGKADYLMIDVHDLSITVSSYRNTTFSNCAYEFYNTDLYRKYSNEVQIFNFMDIPEFLWYPYIDLFFEKILKRFDNNHIILTRFHACEKYVSKDGRVKDIPQDFLKPFHANSKYNDKVRKVEEYIINKVNPYVIDISKYFIVDEKLWGNLNGVHYQKDFYEEALKIVGHILFGKNSEKNNDKISACVTAKILNENMANDQEFLKYLNEIELPFVSFQPLDKIFRILPSGIIVKYRKVIARFYEVAFNLDNELLSNLSDKEIIELIIRDIDENEMCKTFIEFIHNFYKDDNSIAIKYLEDIFLNMLNDGDVHWVEFLEKIEEYAPNDRNIISYRLQYFQAVNNLSKIEEYEKKIKNIAAIL